LSIVVIKSLDIVSPDLNEKFFVILFSNLLLFGFVNVVLTTKFKGVFCGGKLAVAVSLNLIVPWAV